MMLVGFQSHHSNRKEDRRYKFFFRRSRSLKLAYKSGWQKANSYDRIMDFKLSSSQIFFAVYSRHSNRFEDREFYFRTASVVKPCSEITSISYDTRRGRATVSKSYFTANFEYNNRGSKGTHVMVSTLTRSQQSSVDESYSFSRTSGHEHGFEVGVTAGGKIGIPFVAKGEASVTVSEFKYSFLLRERSSEV